jgi:hypothetical protein
LKACLWSGIIKSRRLMQEDSALVARRNECISKGITGLNKPQLASCKSASRRLQHVVFKDELASLDALLYKVERNEARHDGASGGRP